MKIFLLFLLCGTAFCFPFKNKPAPVETAAIVAPASPNADTISFAAQIQPILQNSCNPCHFPGGKMYEKMPFDQAKTILEHPEGVLKRFKSGEENKLLKQFFAEHGK